MAHYHIIKSAFGGSEVFDENGQQVGYSLPSVLGGGEDFFDMAGNPIGQSFTDGFGMSDFVGFDSNSYGFMNQEFMMGQDAWLEGDPFGNNEGNES